VNQQGPIFQPAEAPVDVRSMQALTGYDCAVSVVDLLRQTPHTYDGKSLPSSWRNAV
jgi:hypothetical protein